MRIHRRLKIADSRWQTGRAGALVLALVALAAAEVPLPAYWGRPVPGSARDLAFGGLARLDAGPSSWLAAPAMLAFAARPAAEVTAGFNLAQEQRTRIVYDQFENAVGEVVVADNAHGSARFGPLAVAVPLAGRLGIAAGIAPVASWDYDYYKAYRDDFYAIIGEDIVRQSGTLYAAGLGVGVKAHPKLGIGATASYRFGARRLDITTIRQPDTTFELETGKPSGIGFGAGLAVEPVARLVINAGYSGGTKLAGWRQADEGHAAVDRAQPHAVKLGLAYQAPGALPSRVMAELGYELWHGADTTLSNTLVARAGVEHLMLNSVRLRYGFGVEPEPFDPTVQVVQAGAGVGFDAGIMKVDIGARFTRDVLGSSLFRTPLNPSDQTVHESGGELALTLSREF